MLEMIGSNRDHASLLVQQTFSDRSGTDMGLEPILIWSRHPKPFIDVCMYIHIHTHSLIQAPTWRWSPFSFGVQTKASFLRLARPECEGSSTDFQLLTVDAKERYFAVVP